MLAFAQALTRWGIRANAGNALNGDVVTILYNHPGGYTIGDWPSVFPNGSVYSNGGIPQAANLTRHLEKVKADIEVRFPDPNHAVRSQALTYSYIDSPPQPDFQGRGAY